MYYSIARRLLFRGNGSANVAEHVQEEKGFPARSFDRPTP